MKNFKGNSKIVLIKIVSIVIVLVVVYFVSFRKSQNQPNDFIETPESIINTEPTDNDFVDDQENNDQEAKVLPVEEESKQEPENPNENNQKTEISFTQCLADAGVVVYGTRTCLACAQFVENFGGYSAVDPIFIDCNQNWDRCSQEMQTSYVPEIQIKGKLFHGSRTPQALAEETGCEIK